MIVIHIGAVLLGIAITVVAIVLLVTDTGTENAVGQAASLLWVRFVTFPIALGLIVWGGNGISVTFRRSRHAKSKGRTITADEKLRVYESRDSRSPLVAELPEGTEIEPGTVSEADGVDWTSVKLADGKQGYVLGRLLYYTVLRASIEQDTPFYDSLLAESPVSQLPAGTEVEINETAWDGSHSKVGAWLKDGKKVYIRSGAKIRWL